MNAAQRNVADPAPLRIEHAPDAWPSHAPAVESLIRLYLDPALTIADIAKSLGLTCSQLIALTKLPLFIELLDEFEEATQERAARLVRCSIDLAARTFVRIAETADKPETARKAAGAIVRMHKDRARTTNRDRGPDTGNPPRGTGFEHRATDSLKESVASVAVAQTVRPPPTMVRIVPEDSDESDNADASNPTHRNHSRDF